MLVLKMRIWGVPAASGLETIQILIFKTLRMIPCLALYSYMISFLSFRLLSARKTARFLRSEATAIGSGASVKDESVPLRV